MGNDTQRWNELAAQIAVDSIRATTAAGSGHPTSSLSCAHLLAVLFADHLRVDVKDPAYLANDRFILSKGHAAPALYAVLKASGAFDDEVLLSLRKQGSPLQGHPAPLPDLPWVDVASGSLGQGLAVGLGMALAMRIDGIDANVWVMLGDSEMAEGSVWEAMEATSFHGAGNVTAILDLNRLGQRGETMHGWNADVFRDRAEAFGWSAIQIDGHDVDQIDLAYRNALADERPTLIVARTEKGHGCRSTNQENWHGARGARRSTRTRRSASSAATVDPVHPAGAAGAPHDPAAARGARRRAPRMTDRSRPARRSGRARLARRDLRRRGARR